MARLSWLTNIDSDEVSPVDRPAIRRRFVLRKNDEGELDIAKEIGDVLEIAYESEGALTDLLRKNGVSEAGIEAAVTIARLAKGFEDELPAELTNAFGEILKAQKAPTEDDPEDAADTADCGDDMEKRDFSADQRRADAKSGAALPDGSFPIETRGDLDNALKLVGKAKDPSKAKAHIKSRAAALGLSKLLPESWGSGVSKGEEPTMSEGTGVAVPVKKEDGSWDLSGIPVEARPFYEDVMKARDAAEAAAGELEKRVEKAEKDAVAANDKLATSEFVQKAEALNLVGEAEELGAVLKEASEKLEPETFEKLEGFLTTAQERIKKGDLFKEYGKRGLAEESAGDAMAQIEKLADELVEKESDLGRDDAIAKVLETSKGRELYAQYKAENIGGGVA